MTPLTADDPETKSADLLVENLGKLRDIFPEAFTEGGVDFEVLKGLLGGKLDEREEKYGLTWHGKRRARQLALTPSTGTLRPCPEDSVDWDTTQNLMIEGDNLEVLKLLQKSYAGKVKLIYIDPPYNTGGDFVYPDDFQDNIRNYETLMGWRREDGEKLSSLASWINPQSSGRFHTHWLNMLYPRLKLARTLLRNDGVLFVSIDDNELDNLLQICGELFGDENFCGTFIWEKKKKPSFLNANMGSVTDYIVCFARNRSSSPPFAAGAVEDGKKYPFNNAGNGVQVLSFPSQSVRFALPNQRISAQDMSEGNIKTELLDDVVIVDGKNIAPFRLKGEWRYSQAKLQEFVEAGAEILISKVPFRPNYVNRSGELKKSANLLSHRTNGVPTNEDATEEVRQLFASDVMSHPKPSGLLKYLIRAVTTEDDIVMDFFAGSGSTAHGLWRQNLEDQGTRRFILVQLPEPLAPDTPESKAAFDFCSSRHLNPTIAEICKERLRRTAKSITDSNPLFRGDFGFRTFKLASSNIRAWEPGRDNLAETLAASVDHLKTDRTESDILFELLLKLGLELTVPVETTTIAGNTVHSIGSGVLLACLSEAIKNEDIEALALGIAALRVGQNPAGESQVVLRDAAFSDDVAKTNLTAILQQNGIQQVRSI